MLIKYRSCLPTTSFGTNFEGTETLLFLTLWAVWCIVTTSNTSLLLFCHQNTLFQPSELFESYSFRIGYICKIWDWCFGIISDDVCVWGLIKDIRKVWSVVHFLIAITPFLVTLPNQTAVKFFHLRLRSKSNLSNYLTVTNTRRAKEATCSSCCEYLWLITTGK